MFDPRFEGHQRNHKDREERNWRWVQDEFAEFFIIEGYEVSLTILINIHFVLKQRDLLHVLIGKGQDGDQKIEKQDVCEVNVHNLQNRELELSITHSDVIIDTHSAII